ncbi:MAG: hypothetical protein WAU33_13110 [Candidatus Binataceae bacterium]|jgi:hypothetical protein
MRYLLSKSDWRALSSMLALIVLLGSIPLSASVVIVSSPNQPELTVNICRPLQMFDRVSTTLLGRPAMHAPAFVLSLSGLVTIKPIVPIIECKVVPDTPPPEQFV